MALLTAFISTASWPHSSIALFLGCAPQQPETLSFGTLAGGTISFKLGDMGPSLLDFKPTLATLHGTLSTLSAIAARRALSEELSRRRLTAPCSCKLYIFLTLGPAPWTLLFLDCYNKRGHVLDKIGRKTTACPLRRFQRMALDCYW